MNIDVSEVNVLAVDFGKGSAKTVAAVHTAIAKAAHDTVANAKMIAPVDTGNLRNSVSATVIGLNAEVGPTANYGRYVEEGTSRMAPQAFMGPSFDRVVPDFVRALEQAAQL